MKNIIIKNISMKVKNKTILEDINLVINEGETVAILGPNGAGKTTLVNSILGLCRCRQGSIQNDYKKIPAYKVGVHMQESCINGLMKVGEVLKLFLFDGDNKELLEKFQLSDKLKQRVATLSGGEKQKLQLISMLQNNPEAVFIDEITTGLDAASRENIISYLKSEIVEKEKTLVMVTHYFEEVDALAKRVIFMKDGKVVEDGYIENLYKKYGIQKSIHIEINQIDNIKTLPNATVIGKVLVVPIEKKEDMIITLNYIAEQVGNVISYTIKEPSIAELYRIIIGMEDESI